MKLEKIFRQAAESEIIMNAHKINKGEPVTLNKYSKDFLFVRRNSPDAIIAAMCTLIKEKLPDYVHADRKDIQILTPTRKSAVGAQRLNRIMQQYLNPPSADKMEKEVVLYTMILHSWMNWSWHMRLQFTNRRAVNIRRC